jgi:quercetin dioxygenase-like cupin family protein
MRMQRQEATNGLTIPRRCGIIGGMELKITRWNRTTPPTEDELLEAYRQEGLSPYSWSNGPGDVYPAHAHSYDKVLYVLRGSITWQLPELGQEIETFPGDRIDLPRGALHAARVGPHGVTCLEAHLP